MLIYEFDARVTDITLGAIWQVKLGAMLFDIGIQTAPATTLAAGAATGAVWAVAIAIAMGETESVRARARARVENIVSSFKGDCRRGQKTISSVNAQLHSGFE